jgi:hypothetical protein
MVIHSLIYSVIIYSLIYQWLNSPCKDLVALRGRILNLFTHSVRLLWTNDQPVAKAEDNTTQKKIGQTCMP